MKLDTFTRHDRIARDERAVSEILGAIFVFALLIMVLALLQLWAVPAANQQTEFDHNQRALSDMQSFASDVDRAAGLGKTGSSTLEVGPQYSTRMFLINPPAPAGTLETTDGTIRIENMRAVNTETADHLDGDVPLEFDTKSLTFRPNYNEYANAPATRYEGWTLYNEFEATNIVHSQRSPISGNRISLVALDGTQSTSTGGSLVVPTEPISAPSQTVTIRKHSQGEPLNITITTGLNATDWEDILVGEMMASGGHVESVSDAGDDQVTISLNGSQTFDLRMAKVGIGSKTTDEGAHYITAQEKRPVLDTTGGTVTVQVRDRFNNPVSGVEVTFESSNSGIDFGSDEVVESDEDGTASAHFTNSNAVETATITVEAPVNDEPLQTKGARGTVNFTGVPVHFEGIDDTSDSEINPDAADTLTLQSATIVSEGSGNTREWFVDVTFENKGSDKVIAQTRVNAFVPSALGGRSGIDDIELAVIDDTVHEIGGLYVGGHDPPFKNDIASNSNVTQRFEIQYVPDSGPNQGTAQNFQVVEGDFYIYSIKFDDGSVARYFITPRSY